MGTTLKALKDQIIIDNNISGNVNFPDLRLNRLINLAQRYVQTQLNGLGMKKWESSAPLTLTAGTFVGVPIKSAPVPTNMAESPKAVKFIDVSNGISNGLAFEIGENLFFENITNSFLTPTISKPKFMRLANNLYLSPSSITSGTVYFYKVVSDLSNDADTSEVPPEFDDNILKHVAIAIDGINGKLQDKQLALAELDKDISSQFEKFVNKQAVQKQNENQQLQ